MIKNFTIYGERCSGTNFLEAIFTGASYFHKDKKPAFDLPLTWDFGHKHFFGFNDEDIVNNGDDTLFIGIVRNPYDWLASLFRHKHHIPQVNFCPKNFLFGEWYSIEHNIESENFLQEYTKDRNFLTGERYANVFELRRNKLDYLYNTMPKLAKNYILIRYEDLCDDRQNIIEAISERFNLKIVNDRYIESNPKPPSNILKEYEEEIETNLEWKIEGLTGYAIKPKNIIDFYQQNNIDPKFDSEFYESIYPETKDFYQPFCKDLGIDDRHRLFYHYKTYGMYSGAKINISCLHKEVKQLVIEKISTKNIEEIVPVSESFADDYIRRVEEGKKISEKSRVALVSLARNCDSQLSNSIDTIIQLKSKKLDLFIYENDSEDKTKDILQDYANENSNISISCNQLGLEEIRDRSLTRTNRLALYRNECVKWLKKSRKKYDYVIVLDLDADLGFSINGIYNSIYWLDKIDNAGGMGSYSILLNHHNYVHYDSFAVRLNDWQPSEEEDHNNKWFRDFHPPIGSDPIPFYSCFGGLAVYKAKAFLSGNYNGDLGSEHVEFHKSLKENGWDMYLNPSSRFFSVFEVI